MGKWYGALDKADADAFKRSIISGAIYRFTTAYIFQCFLLFFRTHPILFKGIALVHVFSPETARR